MDRKAEFLDKKSMKGDEQNTSSENSNNDIYLSKKRRRLAFLDMLLEAADKDPSLTFGGIQEEVDTFMFEVRDFELYRYLIMERCMYKIMAPIC